MGAKKDERNTFYVERPTGGRGMCALTHGDEKTQASTIFSRIA